MSFSKREYELLQEIETDTPCCDGNAIFSFESPDFHTTDCQLQHDVPKELE